MNKGWTKIKKRYHFFNGADVTSLCHNTKHPHLKIGNYSERYQFFLDPKNYTNPILCDTCNRLRNKQIKENNKKLSISNYKLKERICSEDGCNVKGVAYVSTTSPEKEHYCITHNFLVQGELH